MDSTFHNIPIGFEITNKAFFHVEKEEWQYHIGNEDQNVGYEDCLPWEAALNLTSHCSNKCLPVNLQYLWKENVDRPRCQNIMDHFCMLLQISKV